MGRRRRVRPGIRRGLPARAGPHSARDLGRSVHRVRRADRSRGSLPPHARRVGARGSNRPRGPGPRAQRACGLQRTWSGARPLLSRRAAVRGNEEPRHDPVDARAAAPWPDARDAGNPRRAAHPAARDRGGEATDGGTAALGRGDDDAAGIAPVAARDRRLPDRPGRVVTEPLTRRFGPVHATALNMINMMGIGPFITIPILLTALGGPQAMLGWAVALVVVVADGMVWSELGAAMPGSGGSFRYLVEGFGPATFGRLIGFLFIWQFIFSGPLEIASGYIGFAHYAGYIWTGLTKSGLFAIAALVGVVNIVLLYRRIHSIATI